MGCAGHSLNRIHIHIPVRGTMFQGLQFKAKGQETLAFSMIITLIYIHL